MGRKTIALAVLPLLALGGCERFSANGFGPQLTSGQNAGSQQGRKGQLLPGERTPGKQVKLFEK